MYMWRSPLCDIKISKGILALFSICLNLNSVAKELLKKAILLTEDDAFLLFKEKSESLGIKTGDFMMPIRVAVTGSKISPPLIGSIKILGLEEATKRIEKALHSLT